MVEHTHPPGQNPDIAFEDTIAWAVANNGGLSATRKELWLETGFCTSEELVCIEALYWRYRHGEAS